MPGAGIGFMRGRRSALKKKRTILTGRRYILRGGKATIKKTTLYSTIKKVVARAEETKCCGFAIETGTPHNAQITNADAVPLLPVVAQGTGSSERVGDKVRPTLLKVKGCVSFYDRGQSNVLSPMVVKIFCLRQKGLGNLQTAIPQFNLNALLDNGGATNSWDGSTQRALWRINSDLFDVLATKTIKLSDTDVENHKAQTGHYEFNIKPPALMKWSPGQQYPDNYAPFFVLGWFYEDGSTPAAIDVNVVNTAYGFLYYKDA